MPCKLSHVFSKFFYFDVDPKLNLSENIGHLIYLFFTLRGGGVADELAVYRL